MNNIKQRKQCNRCKVNLPLSHFNKKRSGDYYKWCKQCNEKFRQYVKCEHNRRQSVCKECKGSDICIHNRRRCFCIDCKGSQICEHKKEKSKCKECNGSQICKHKRFKSNCIECHGGGICEHNKRKTACKLCGGSQICKHNKNKAFCKECNGKQICKHNTNKTLCKKCGGGSICEHNKRRFMCRQCNGGGFCKHEYRKSRCKICNLGGYLKTIVACRIRHALEVKQKRTIEYLDCTIEFYMKYLEEQFTPEMTWENMGKVWHIDHVVPVCYGKPSNNEKILRLHYINTQPLFVKDNLEKSNNIRPKDFEKIEQFEAWKLSQFKKQHDEIASKFNL